MVLLFFVDNDEAIEEIEENKWNIYERQGISDCAHEKRLHRVFLKSKLGFLDLLSLGGCSFLSLPDSVEQDVDQDDEEGKDETKEKPNIHYLDGGGGGEAVGHRDVEGGEDHHAGDVHGDDGLQELGVSQVVGGLVDDVHEDRG